MVRKKFLSDFLWHFSASALKSAPSNGFPPKMIFVSDTTRLIRDIDEIALICEVGSAFVQKNSPNWIFSRWIFMQIVVPRGMSRSEPDNAKQFGRTIWSLSGRWLTDGFECLSPLGLFADESQQITVNCSFRFAQEEKSSLASYTTRVSHSIT